MTQEEILTKMENRDLLEFLAITYGTVVINKMEISDIIELAVGVETDYILGKPRHEIIGEFNDQKIDLPELIKIYEDSRK